MKALFAFALCAALCGCASAGGRTGTPGLQVRIPQTCERILQVVAVPPARATDDARVAFVRVDAALWTANSRISAGRNCLVEQRTGYQAKKR